MPRKQQAVLPELSPNDLNALVVLELRRQGKPIPTGLRTAARLATAALGDKPPWVTVAADASGASFVAVDVFSDEPWLVRGYLLRADVGLVISRMGVERFRFTVTKQNPRFPRLEPGEGDVTGKVMRGLRLGEIRERALARLQDREIAYEAMQRTGWEISAEDVKQARRLAEAARELPLMRGRKGYPADHYRRIALAYIEEVKERGSRGVLDRLASAEKVERPTIRDWIKRARELGFLAPTKQGRAEARPGPNLYRKEDA